MRIFQTERIVAVPALVTALVLSGCGHTSGTEVAQEVGKTVLVEIAATVIADCKDHAQPNNQSICREQTEAARKLGQSLVRELKPADDIPGADELSNDLDTFIERRRTPAVGNIADTEEISSP